MMHVNRIEVIDNNIFSVQIKKKFSHNAVREKIFNKFYRVGNEDTRKTKGTGLGLFIVKEIVKAHKGTINIHDNRPKGTIFRISLPNKK